MSKSLGTSYIDIVGRTSKFEQSMGRSTRRLQNFEREGRNTQQMLGGLKTALGAIGVGLSVRAIKGFVDEMDNLGKTADGLGLTTNALQELRAVASETAGIASGQFDDAMSQLNRRLSEARMGTGTAKRALEELGISFVNADGSARNSEAVLAEVSDRMRNMTNAADRTRTATDLFGRSGDKMVTMLAKGSVEIDRMRGEFEKLNISEDVIRQAEKLNDQMARGELAAKQFASVALGAFLSLGEGIGTLAGRIAFGNDSMYVASQRLQEASRANLSQLEAQTQEMVRLRAETRAREAEESRVAYQLARQREELQMQDVLSQLSAAVRHHNRILGIRQQGMEMQQTIAQIAERRQDMIVLHTKGEAGLLELEIERLEAKELELKLGLEKLSQMGSEEEQLKAGLRLQKLQLEIEEKKTGVLRLRHSIERSAAREESGGVAGQRSGGGISHGGSTRSSSDVAALTGEALRREANKAGKDNNIRFQREAVGGGEVQFRRFIDGFKDELISEEDLKKALEEREKGGSGSAGGAKGAGGAGGGKEATNPAKVLEDILVILQKLEAGLN